MNDFDKTFVLAIYNSFLKIKFSCDKEKIIPCSFQKMLSKLTCVLIYSFIKCALEHGSENFVKLAEICPSQSLLLRSYST